jgi:hypothetical protein
VSRAKCSSHPPRIEHRFLAGAVALERALLADRVRSLEDPVLPGGQPREDLRFHRLGAAEAQVGFKPSQSIGREARALLEENADFVLPVDVVEREGHQAEFLRRLCVERLADLRLGAIEVGRIGETLDAETADDLGLVTFAYDGTDWDDEVRLILEERASFSPDALTGLEANLRFAGPETMETRIFGRLTAWQNWIFQRPNAVGDNGSLKRYGTGERPTFDPARV